MPSRLEPCPASPNCVSSQATDLLHRVAPWPFDGDVAAAKARLKALVASFPRTMLVGEDDDRLHFTFRTPGLGYVDDVQFVLDAGARLVHVRSASRTGRFDVFANRVRVWRLRRAWGA